jgi:small subunit ribosomal protein S4
MIRQKKKYSRPQKPFDKIRIEDENVLKEKYGLKNKKEIWKADASIGRVRNLAKQLITASDEEKNAFIERLQARGFKIESIADTLALNKEDWLGRRLQTVLVSKGLTTTPKQARQLIAHKHVSIGDQIVNVPSYMVTSKEEAQVKLNITLRVAKPKSKEEKIKEEIASESDDDIMASKEGVDVAEKSDEEVVKEEASVAEEEKVEEVPVEDKKEDVAPAEEEKVEGSKTEDNDVNVASEDAEDTKEETE